MAVITDLPEELLDTIFVLLLPKNFLALCQSNRELYTYRLHPLYWRTVTSKTFRMPISPLLKADGARWYYLYKRLKTQTRLFTWGKGSVGNLGPGRSYAPPIGPRPLVGGRRGRMQHRPPPFPRATSTWPTETHIPDEVKVIADLQCGGWSTSILSSEGKIYVAGRIDGQAGMSAEEPNANFEQLHFPSESQVAIHQFSSGRGHIMALTDDGEILSWTRARNPGLRVFSRESRNFGGKAAKVVAGWQESSTYVPETGLIYWKPVSNTQEDAMLDGVHIQERLVPGTARKVLDDGKVVEVTTWVVLEGFIVWITSDNRVVAVDIAAQPVDRPGCSASPFEVPGYYSDRWKLQDIQGQYSRFAVFTDHGEVLAGDISYLKSCAETAAAYPPEEPYVTSKPSQWDNVDSLVAKRPTDAPMLQQNQVIGLAFGDHHYHALHANGTVTSYGTDSESHGSLGLGSIIAGARFRGLQARHHLPQDSILNPLAERRGRQVWFEPEKKDWLNFLEESSREESGLASTSNSSSWSGPPAAEVLSDANDKFMFSEWIEQEGRHWEEGPIPNSRASDPAQSEEKDDDFLLGSYFTINVAAAGWHSGALVLVDEHKALEIRQKWITTIPQDSSAEEDGHLKRARSTPGHFESGPTNPDEIYVWKRDGFPKVKLPNGRETPGLNEPRKWRDGMPTLEDLGIEPPVDWSQWLT